MTRKESTEEERKHERNLAAAYGWMHLLRDMVGAFPVPIALVLVSPRWAAYSLVPCGITFFVLSEQLCGDANGSSGQTTDALDVTVAIVKVPKKANQSTRSTAERSDLRPLGSGERVTALVASNPLVCVTRVSVHHRDRFRVRAGAADAVRRRRVNGLRWHRAAVWIALDRDGVIVALRRLYAFRQSD
jgi:hypothetical protein